jgi:hypothetical protein
LYTDYYMLIQLMYNTVQQKPKSMLL